MLDQPKRIRFGYVKLLIYKNDKRDYQNMLHGLGPFHSPTLIQGQFETESTIGINLPLIGASVGIVKEPYGIEWCTHETEINVKAYPFSIIIDKCLEEAVPFIDSLKDTMTCWCCCNHGHPSESEIWFISKLPEEELSGITNKFGGRLHKLKEIDNIPGWREILSENITINKKEHLAWVFTAPLCRCPEEVKRMYWGTEYPNLQKITNKTNQGYENDN